MHGVIRFFTSPSPIKWFIILTVIAVGLALGLPPDPQALAHLHASSLSYRLALTALLVPYILIWFLGFFTLDKMRSYLTHVRKSKEGPAFRLLTLGIGVLAFGLIVPTIISLVLNNLAVHYGFRSAAAMAANYLTLAVALASFSILCAGAYRLSELSKIRPGLRGVQLFVAGFILLGVIYSFMVLHNRYTAHNPYHLGPWPLILTYVAPYLYAWFLGLYGAYHLRLYSSRTHGLLYRRSLDQFSFGLIVAIAGSVASQFVTGAISANQHFHLVTILLIDYSILLIIAAGLVLLALGTKGLKRIEEV